MNKSIAAYSIMMTSEMIHMRTEDENMRYTTTAKFLFQRSCEMGLHNNPDIFQACMFELFSDLEYVRAYIDDLLVTSSSTFEKHLRKVEKVFACLSNVGWKINANKSHFVQSQVKYLGYWIT